MIFKGLSENAGWTVAAYHTIWRYGYDFMLDMAQIMINEDLDNSQVFTADVGSAYVEKTQEIASCGNVIRNCKTMEQEYGVLRVCGISKVMQCPVCFDFFNQTNLVKLSCPAGICFQEYGERAFDVYMDSLEIRAHCARTKRNI